MFVLVKMCKATLVITLSMYWEGEAILFNNNKLEISHQNKQVIHSLVHLPST